MPIIGDDGFDWGDPDALHPSLKRHITTLLPINWGWTEGDDDGMAEDVDEAWEMALYAYAGRSSLLALLAGLASFLEEPEAPRLLPSGHARDDGAFAAPLPRG